MELRLINNSSLAITSALPQSIVSACTSLFINGCPNVSGITVLRSCPNLDRVFVNIGSVLGPMSELVSYTNIDGGFDTTGNFVNKPYIIGTFTVTDFYTQAELSACTNAFYNNSLTIVADPNKNIDTVLANAGVQVLDEDEANFNPAVAIKLQAGGLGTLLSSRYTEHGGKWFALKSDLANITQNTASTVLRFGSASSLTDSNGIVTDDTTISYNFDSFDEFEYFTGLTTLMGDWFDRCSNLTSIKIPSGITTINGSAFRGCSSLVNLTIPSNVTLVKGYIFGSTKTGLIGTLTLEPNDSLTLSNWCFSYGLYTTFIVHEGLTTIPDSCCRDCPNLSYVDLPSTITSIGSSAFRQNSSLSTFIIRATTPPPISSSTYDIPNNTNLKIYVPYSADHSILNSYQTANIWSNYKDSQNNSKIHELDENGNIPT